MRKPFVLNTRLNEIYNSEQNKYMAKKLENAKSIVNSKCPESFLFYKYNFFKFGQKDSRCR
jgi:hypothetical protein